MDFTMGPDLLDLQNEATEVGRAAAAGLEVTEDSWLRGVSAEFARELGRRGWIGMTWPTNVGGGGRSALERFVVVEALISEGAPMASCWFADRQIGPTLLRFGTPRQQQQFLPDIISGTSAWCIGMSEPGAGSDVASLRTTARRDGDHWLLNGTKVWTSGAASARWCYLIARTDPDAPAHRGLSEFVVDLTLPGIEIRPIRDMSDDAHFCELVFDDTVVAEESRVGELNGAFKQIMSQMEYERGGIDRLVSNRRLYLDALDALDVDQRSDPLIRDRIGRLEGGYVVGRQLVLREVLGAAPRGFSAVTKTWCTEFEQRVAEFCGHVAGPSAQLSGRLSRALCYAPAYTLMGGTTEILRNICSERMLGLPRWRA